MTAATPANPQALSATDFAAIVAEARTVPRNLPPDGHIARPGAGRTLPGARLAAMLAMPQFGGVPQYIRPVLIDQAATWDLFDYQRPTDAAALWGRLRSEDVKGRTAWDFFRYIPDPTWSPTSLAMASVFKCFPRAAWTADDPVVYAVTRNDSWQWGNVTTDMHDCLPEIATGSVHWTPALIAKVSAILIRKFSDELREDGCTRHGPDSCLVIFQALYGLDPQNPELPALLKKMEPAFFDNNVSLLQAASKGSTPTKIADVMHTRLIRRMAFVTVKLPVLLDRPKAWPHGEIQRTIAQALQTSAALTRLWHLDYGRYYYDPDRALISPWSLLQGKYAAQVAPAMQSLGRAYAHTEPCTAELPPGVVSAAFTNAYAVEHVRLGNVGCNQVGQLPLDELIAAQPQRRRQLMALLRPIAKQLGKGGPLREDALNQVAAACRAKHPMGRTDPFGFCAEVRARDAAKLAAMPKVDPLACPENTLAKVEQTLSVTPAGGDFAACRKNPADTRQAIVALAYHATDGNAQDGNGDYDLDLAIVDIASGDILAHRHEPNGIESDAVSLDRVWLDTARYDLAPGKRAFGVRSSNWAHCWQCAYGITTLSLYLHDGKQLRKLLTTTVSETSNSEGEGGDESDTSTTVTVLCTGRGKHHGLADLWTSSVNVGGEADEDHVRAPCGPDTHDALWRYDGKQYVEDKSPH